MKQLLVIGLGDFGMNVALELAKRGHKVTVIDSNIKKIEIIKEKVMQAVIADARDKNVLEDIIKTGVDIAIIAIGKMETSTLAALYLRELGVQKIMVKPVNDDHGLVLKSVGATDLIFPDKEIAEKIALQLSNDSLIDYLELAPEYSLVEVAVPDEFVGKRINETKIRNKYGVIIIALKDVMNNEFLMSPEPEYIFKTDCVMFVIGKQKDIDKLKTLSKK